MDYEEKYGRKSSFSGQGGNCVLVKKLDNGNVQLRDSKNPDGGVLEYTPKEWDAFVKGAKNNEFTF